MSDLERLIEMLRSWSYEPTDELDTYRMDGRTYSQRSQHEEQVVTLGKGRGYGGFYCEFYFDADGKLIEHGVWE